MRENKEKKKKERKKERNAPTLTAVLVSSSEARLAAPCLLLMLRREVLRGVRMMALNLGEAPVGEAGGETVMPYIDRREVLEGTRE